MPTTQAPPSTAGTPPATINPKLIVPFVNSVRNVFATMVRVEAVVERPMLKQHPASSYDISGIIGFSGEIVGSVVVSFTRQAGEALVEAFAGVRLAMGTPDFADAIGELANMIAGSAKKDLGATANITVPNVVIGAGHQIARLSDVPCLVIPCRTSVGNFAVEVNVKNVQKPA
jgi:chemotaxis protein CheX